MICHFDIKVCIALLVTTVSSQSLAKDCDADLAIASIAFPQIMSTSNYLSIDRPVPLLDTATDRADDFTFLPVTVRSAMWKYGWVGEKPSVELIDKWVANPPDSIARCYRDNQSKRGLSLVSEQRGVDLIRTYAGSSAGPFLNHVSALVYNRNKTEAMLTITQYGNSPGGKNGIYIVGLVGGKWLVQGYRITAVSG